MKPATIAVRQGPGRSENDLRRRKRNDAIWRWQPQKTLCARSLSGLTPAALHQLDNGGFEQRHY
jgi:hypothetical protein